MNNFRKP